METDHSFIVYSCYLALDKSPWAEPEIFFEHFISQLYVHIKKIRYISVVTLIHILVVS